MKAYKDDLEWYMESLLRNLEPIKWDDSLFIKQFKIFQNDEYINKDYMSELLFIKDYINELYSIREKEILDFYFNNKSDNKINSITSWPSVENILSHLKIIIDDFNSNDNNFYKWSSKEFYIQKSNFINLYWVLDAITKWIFLIFDDNFTNKEIKNIYFHNIKKNYEKDYFVFEGKDNSLFFKYLLELSSLEIFKNIKDIRNNLVHSFEDYMNEYSLNFAFKILFIIIVTFMNFLESIKDNEMMEAIMNSDIYSDI